MQLFLNIFMGFLVTFNLINFFSPKGNWLNLLAAAICGAAGVFNYLMGRPR